MGPNASKITAALFFWPIVVLGILSSATSIVMTNPSELLYWGFSIGFLLFVIAKVSVIRTGQLSTFGSEPLSARMKKYYFSGYGLMIASGVISILLYFSMLMAR